MSGSIDIVEVAPRDGLQTEPRSVPTDVKVKLVRRAASYGARRIEVGSFVHPQLVPQMADAEEVVRATTDLGLSRIGVVVNRRGLERALDCGVEEVNFVLPVTDAFCERNQRYRVREGCRIAEEACQRAHADGLGCTVTLAVAFGCPYSGEVGAGTVADLAGEAARWGASEVALADTIGVGVPTQVRALAGAVRERAGALPLRFHFHNTRNTGVANAVAAVECAAGALDAGLGGAGGCPFAPEAVGNVPTEDLVWMLERMGLDTGIDLGGVIEASAWLRSHVDQPLPALLGRAGAFPPSPAPPVAAAP